MKAVCVTLIYISFYIFVFAMCYFFSPWFAILALVPIVLNSMNKTMSLFDDLVMHHFKRQFRKSIYKYNLEDIKIQAIQSVVEERSLKK